MQRSWQPLAHRLRRVCLDNIAFLELVEPIDADTALVARLDFAHIILESAKALDSSLEQLLAASKDADLGVAGDRARRHVAARDLSRPSDLEYLADLGVAL